MAKRQEDTWLGLSAADWAWLAGTAATVLVAGVAIRRVREAQLAAAAAREADMAGSSVPSGARAQYVERYDSAVLTPSRVAQIDRYIDRIVANRARYEAAARPSGTPWYVVGALHLLEHSLAWDGHFHNGDPLTDRTVRTPRGRPLTGSPPFTWDESAVDALGRFTRWHNWTLPGVLYQTEKYNGWGYQNQNVPSPYLWSFTDQYQSGKFREDESGSHYDPNLVSAQAGAAAIYKRMEQRGIIRIPRE